MYQQLEKDYKNLIEKSNQKTADIENKLIKERLNLD